MTIVVVNLVNKDISRWTASLRRPRRDAREAAGMPRRQIAQGDTTMAIVLRLAAAR